ncbi:hypothetical protein JST99_03310 [Candidatus Dependentiae bacterium]|nr:hypothetical protein [Candidatus Dependentiae bacterium]MCC7415109.1 hypothetical protein [Campylobacterota bacterium]
MKKIVLFCLLSLARTNTAGVDKTPIWAQAADSILIALEGLSDALVNDSVLYDSWRSSLEQLQDELILCDDMRQQLFDAIHAGITQAEMVIQNARTNSQIAAKAAHVREQYLLGQLAALRLETQTEIAYLNRLLAEVSHELAETQKAYVELSKATTTKANELVKSLAIARDNYEAMVAKRTHFLTMLNALIANTKATTQTTISQAEKIKQDVFNLTDEIIES